MSLTIPGCESVIKYNAALKQVSNVFLRSDVPRKRSRFPTGGQRCVRSQTGEAK